MVMAKLRPNSPRLLSETSSRAIPTRSSFSFTSGGTRTASGRQDDLMLCSWLLYVIYSELMLIIILLLLFLLLQEQQAIWGYSTRALITKEHVLWINWNNILGALSMGWSRFPFSSPFGSSVLYPLLKHEGGWNAKRISRRCPRNDDTDASLGVVASPLFALFAICMKR